MGDLSADNDMAPTFVLRYAEASHLAESELDAHALLIRAIEHLKLPLRLPPPMSALHMAAAAAARAIGLGD